MREPTFDEMSAEGRKAVMEYRLELEMEDKIKEEALIKRKEELAKGNRKARRNDARTKRRMGRRNW